MFTLTQLQKEVLPWAERNFGPRNREMAHQPLLGLFEELGEIAEAIGGVELANDAHRFGVTSADDHTAAIKEQAAEMLDGAADATVFMADYCNAMGIDLGLLWRERHELIDADSEGLPFDGSNMIIALIGRLSHAHLKMAQGIRVNEDHEAALRAGLRHLLTSLEHLNKLAAGAFDSDDDLPTTVEKVWTKVRERDWTKNKETGDGK